jgi:hypothetical protein
MTELHTRTHTRVAGHRGKLPPKKGAEKFSIGWIHDYLRTSLPAPSYPIDVSYGILDWHMLGNGPDPTCTVRPNGVGDCTFAGREHYKMAKAAAARISEKWEDSNALVEEYLAYDHGRDRGANIADLLLTWFRAGKILAFAPVDYTNRQQCDSAMQAFNGLYVGVQLTDDADELFTQHLPWTVTDGQQPNPAEGHCIVKVGSDGASEDTWVTWGGLQKSTLAWTAACLDEAWVMITSEDEAHQIDLAKLRADIKALEGQGGS